MKSTTAYALTWISTAIAVSMAIFITKEPSCLWAMFIPTFVSFSSRSNDDNKEK